ncbi:MAG: RNA polymerase sigma factor [Actinomycetota bacterium]
MGDVSNRTDAQIIESSFDQPSEFSTVFQRHFGAVHRYLSTRVGIDVADELASETFARAFGARARYRLDRSHALPWLFGIATNLIKEHIRSETAHLKALARQAGQTVTELDMRLDEHAGVARARADVARALATLHPGDRDVLLLVGWADLRYQDVASALSIPIGTVRSRLSRARRLMRIELQTTKSIADLSVDWSEQEDPS